MSLDQQSLEIAAASAPGLLPATGPGAVLALMTAAVAKGMPVETMESLQKMYHAEQDRQAARECSQALADFQRACPAIPKSSTAKVTSKRTGGTFTYTYAALDQIAAVVNPLLHPRGLSYSWDTVIEDGRVNCSCILRHANGHEIKARYSEVIAESTVPGADTRIATTVAMRRSLIQVLGLTTADPDPESEAMGDKIGPDQEANLEALISEVGADKAKFLKWLGVASLADLPEADYKRAVMALEQKRKA